MRCVIARPQVTGASRLRKEPGTCQSLVWSRAGVVAAPLLVAGLAKISENGERERGDILPFGGN